MNQSDLNEIHNRMTVCDAHCDLVDRLMRGKSELGIRSSMGHVDIPRMRKGGVDAQVFACCTYGSKQPKSIVEQKLSLLHSQFRKYSSHIELALKLSDISKAEQAGKLSGIFAIEGGDAIENDLDNLRMFHKLGVRIMTIAWKSNDWADASQQKMKHNGLTEFGKDVIREMNRLGIIIDTSHSADKTVEDILQITNDPIIASHSNAKALCNHPRNLTDHLIEVVASSGGVICVNFYPPFVRKYRACDPPRPSFTKVVDHIEHIIKIGGIDSVGIGSDFDGIDKVVEGLEDSTKMPNITAELLKRGYLEEEITKIMGGNFLRVFGQVCGV